MAVVLSLSSCVRHRQLVNFRDPDAPEISDYSSATNIQPLRVQPDDILYITINSLNDEVSRPFNIGGDGNTRLPGGGGAGPGQVNPLLLQGYAVDSSGYIQFPNVGRIEVGGLTLEGVRENVARAIEPFLNNAAVNVKFLNFRYTILGEVISPGTYSTANERVSLLEAIGTAGDFTPYADRDRIVIIREENGRRVATTLNLQDTEFFTSPYYYLRQNDVIYVEPTQAKIATVADPVSRAISYGSAFLSFVTFVVTIIATTSGN